METNETYWQHRYQNDDIPWDAGAVTTPLKAYFDTLPDKGMRILVPGCGTGHEATYLFQQGFRNVYACDWAADALARFQARTPGFPPQQLLRGDFFKLSGEFDLIVEQTFFCALPPVMRSDYAKQCHRLLVSGGRLAGLLFDTHFPQGPPFGGSREEYGALFSPLFKIHRMLPCGNSIKPRLGSELFFELEKLV